MILESEPPDSVTNALILYYRPTCPACIACAPTFRQVPQALIDSGFGDVTVYMVDTSSIDVMNAIGGRIVTVPKIVYVGDDGDVFVYPTTDRTVQKIVSFVKTAKTNPSMLRGGLISSIGSIGTMISDLFSPLSGGAKKFRVSSKKRKIRSRSPKAKKVRSPRRVRRSQSRLKKWSDSKILKHLIRKSPYLSANANCGKTMTGNDGNPYISKADKNGVCRWQKVRV
jgi:hypothetical protein